MTRRWPTTCVAPRTDLRCAPAAGAAIAQPTGASLRELLQLRERRCLGASRASAVGDPRAIALGLVVIAGAIVGPGAVAVAAGHAIGAGAIADAVSQVGAGLEQPGRRAALEHTACRSILELHQAHGPAATNRAAVVAALLQHYAVDHRLRHLVDRRVLGDQRVDLAPRGALGNTRRDHGKTG